MVLACHTPRSRFRVHRGSMRLGEYSQFANGAVCDCDKDGQHPRRLKPQISHLPPPYRSARVAKENISKVDVPQLFWVARQIDRGDAGIAGLESNGIDRPIDFAHDESGEAVNGCGAHLHGQQ
jgi:hypothetical protein